MAYTIKDILQMEVAPALGCTDPAAVALATAAAASLLPNRAIDRIELWLDPNIYKNGFAVSIPGTQGESGIDLSAALGAFGGDPQLKLEVLEPITTETLRTSKRSEEHTSELQSRQYLVCRLLLEKKKAPRD